jgi:hypothetical protein
MARRRAGTQLLGAALVLLAAAVASPANAQGTLQLEIRGAVDRDSGHATQVSSLGGAVDIDFGVVDLLFGEARTGEVVAARDGSGHYLVATLELEVTRDHGPRARVAAPPARWAARTEPPRRPGKPALGAPRTGSIAGATPTPEATVVTLRVDGETRAFWAPGTATVWGTSGSGTSLGPAGAVVLTMFGDRARHVHQVALFLPAMSAGHFRARLVYEVANP